MKFSIITCSYNCLEGLKAARAQILEQEDVAIEHIIIDGGSTDGTREWLEECGKTGAPIAASAGAEGGNSNIEHPTSNVECRMSNPSTPETPHSPLPTPHSSFVTRHSSPVPRNSSLHWLSEPDKGLYDALNKGLHLATGDIVGVLHTDDVWEHPHVLAHVAEAFQNQRSDSPPPAPCPPSPDLHPEGIYGDLYYVEADDITRIRRVWRSGAYHPRKWRNGWMPPHTALFVRREAALRVGDYRLDHGSAADYEWMLRAGLVHDLTFAHLPEVLVRMRVGGASNQSVQRRLEANRYDRLAWTRNGLTPRPWTLKLKPLRKLPQWLHALRAK